MNVLVFLIVICTFVFLLLLIYMFLNHQNWKSYDIPDDYEMLPSTDGSQLVDFDKIDNDNSINCTKK